MLACELANRKAVTQQRLGQSMGLAEMEANQLLGLESEAQGTTESLFMYGGILRVLVVVVGDSTTFEQPRKIGIPIP
ncbi:hypothetical protein L1887_32784 [Cichorium endivia]|nr:hypothetical protein L1887_32784 [Cichorium endivia]